MSERSESDESFGPLEEGLRAGFGGARRGSVLACLEARTGSVLRLTLPDADEDREPVRKRERIATFQELLGLAGKRDAVAIGGKNLERDAFGDLDRLTLRKAVEVRRYGDRALPVVVRDLAWCRALAGRLGGALPQRAGRARVPGAGARQCPVRAGRRRPGGATQLDDPALRPGRGRRGLPPLRDRGGASTSPATPHGGRVHAPGADRADAARQPRASLTPF